MAQSSYYIGYLISVTGDLSMRVAACAQAEADRASVDIGDPEAWAQTHRWDYAMAPGWVAKVESAVENGITDWGKDPAVITDGDILATVQPMMSAGGGE